MASTVNVCNLALLYLGHSRQISSLTELSAEAGVLRTVFDRTRRMTLRGHFWNFATRTVQLVEDGTTSDEYDYVYPLPVQCLRAVEIVNTASDDKIKFEVRGRKLYTDEADAVLKYVFDETDPNQWDETFQEAMAWGLAARVALAITQSEARQKNAVAMYRLYVGEAEEIDSSEGEPDPVGDYVSARA